MAKRKAQTLSLEWIVGKKKIALFLMSFSFLYRRRIIYAVRKRRNIYGRHSLVSEIFVVVWIQVIIHIIKSKVLFPLWAAR